MALNAVANLLSGGPGADYLNTQDGGAAADHVDCGAGADTYRRDAADLRTSCETLVP